MKNKYIEQFFLLLPYIFMATGVFTLPHSDKKIVITFIISALFSIIYYGFKIITENIRKPIIIVLILSTIYTIFGYYYHPDGSRELRALLCLSVYFLIIPHEKINIKIIPYFLLISGVVSLLNVSFYTYYLSLERETGFLNPNIYGGLTGAMAVAAFSFSFVESKKKVSLSAFLLLLSSTILTQSRTVTAVVILIALVLLLSNNHITKKNISFCTLIALLSLLLFHPQIQERINITKDEIISLKAGNLNTSMGLRLQMWKFAPSIIKDNLLIGVGGEHKKYLNEAHKNHSISNELYRFHPPGYHNEIINKLVKNGLIGTVLLLLLYVIPIKEAFKQIRGKKLMIWSVVSFYIITGITLSPLSQGVTVLLYGLLIIPFCCQVKIKAKI